jgi:hypothetical protein
MMSQAASLQQSEGMLPTDWSNNPARPLLICAPLQRDDALAGIAEMRWLKTFHLSQSTSAAAERGRSGFVLSMYWKANLEDPQLALDST